MATTLTIQFSFDRHIGVPAPLVRFWVDANADQKFGADEEVTELDHDVLIWKGEAEVASGLIKGIWVLARYLGSAGATWTMEVRKDGALIKTATGVVDDVVGWAMVRLGDSE